MEFKVAKIMQRSGKQKEETTQNELQ